MNKYAVIGLGNISSRHRKNLKHLYPDAAIYAMSASGRVPKGPIENADLLVATIDDLIQYKPKMVIVASPATFHAAHVIPLIKAGIPVLIEKPLSSNNIDSKAILEAVDKYKTPVAVGYCLRYLSSSQYLKSIFGKKIIGDIYNAFIEIGQYLPDWRPSKNYRDSVSANANLGGGALLELSHEFDYIEWLLGSIEPLCAVLRSSKELSLDVEDSADILAVNENDTVISVHLDFLQKKAQRKCRFLGSKGSIEWDLIKNQITYITKESEQILFDGSMWERNKMYLSMLIDFELLIDGKPNHCINVHEAQQTVTLIERIKEMALIKKGF